MFGRRQGPPGALPPKELPVPPAAFGGEVATEVFRAWVVDGDLHVSLQRGFDDVRMWGILLADVARHAARIYEAERGMSEGEAVREIRSLFDAELDRPTDPGNTRPLQ